MKVQGLHTYEVARAVVWQALMDPTVLAGTLPGCDELTADGDDAFRGVLNVRVGPVQGTFAGRVQMTNLVAPERFDVHLHGDGPAGFLDGGGQVRLEEAGANTTLHYELTVHVGGRVASVGQRLLESTARAVTRQALDGLASQILGRQVIHGLAAATQPGAPSATAQADGGAGTGAPGAVAPPPDRARMPRPSAAPSTGRFAAGVVRHMVSDALPARRRRWLVACLALIAALWVVWSRLAGQ